MFIYNTVVRDTPNSLENYCQKYLHMYVMNAGLKGTSDDIDEKIFDIEMDTR